MPHLDSPDFPNRKESLLEAVGSFESKVYGLRDDSAEVIDGDDNLTFYEICEPPYVDGRFENLKGPE